MSTPPGVIGPAQEVPGLHGPLGDLNPTGVPDAGARSAWREFLHAIGRTVPDQVNASKRIRIQLRALGRR